MLMQRVYASRALRPFTDQELIALLGQSRERNQRHGITGLLVYREQTFLQALEGEALLLDPVWRAISADRRHAGIVELRCGPVAARSYGDWSMGFFNATWNGCVALPGYARFMDLDFTPGGLAMDPERALGFLQWIRSAGAEG
jgi:hypothetical protein